ncbi:MAG: diacylglycerol/lipid kinase family protein [Acidobacteriaceae bacterium]
MMVKKYKFILNPIAGQGAGAQSAPDIHLLAREGLLDYDVMITERPGHAIELAHAAAMDNFDYVIAVGGDGTSNEVLNGLMQAWNEGRKNTCMGIVGIGRGNDFAYGLGVQPGLSAGFEIIRQDRIALMDVGFVRGGDYPQGRYFGNGVGIGFDAVVGFEAAKLTRLHGFMNYIVAALRTIFLYFRAPQVRVEYDTQVINQPSLMVSIMNGRRMGGGFMMAPDALVDDGLLDLCIAGQMSRFGILRMIPKFMKGTQAREASIKTGRAGKIHIFAVEGVLPAHADGETICTAGKELTIEVINKPMNFLRGQLST